VGILKSREELLPVTCAILSDDDRNRFFAAVKKKTGGHLEKIAKAVQTTSSRINSWMSGETHVPYHALQQIASELQIDMPKVSELRREFQQVVETKTQRRPMPGPDTKREPRERPGDRNARKERSPSRDKSPRNDRTRGQKSRPTNRPDARPKQTPSRGESTSRPAAQNKLTDDRAYWGAVLLTRARRPENEIILDADQDVGQNFAAIWANLTKKAFGVKPDLVLSEDHTVQTAKLEAERVIKFLDRIDFKAGTEPANAPGAPRWVWSNPDWKRAFLKGIFDARAIFNREPSLTVKGLSERMRLSAQKLLAAFELESKEIDGALVVEGEAAIKAYATKIGTANPKLRDQLKVFAPQSAEPQTSERPVRDDGKKRRRRRGGRRRTRGPQRNTEAKSAPAKPTEK
jgi:transcriptional regulator with XRE-family HTH domain